jgi:UDP-N-acetylglucosamine transferase subunit ALG13
LILVTVGTQAPFDRLILAVDRWAGTRGRPDVFAQIGKTTLRPSQMQWVTTLESAAMLARMREAEAIVAHAGMGTILQALQLGKPLVVVPRRAGLGEQRNDHQLATARRFEHLGLARVVYETDQLDAALDAILTARPADKIGAHASGQLIARLRRFLSERGT